MKFKRYSDKNIIILFSILVIVVSTLLLILLKLYGFGSEIKYFGFGIGIGLIIFIIASLVKLKKNGVIYDERDNLIEREASSISFTILQLILSILVLATYRMGSVEINISALTLLLFLLTFIVYGIAYFFAKRKN